MIESMLMSLEEINESFIEDPASMGQLPNQMVRERFMTAYHKYWQHVYDNFETKEFEPLRKFLKKNHWVSPLEMPCKNEAVCAINFDVTENFFGRRVADKLIEEIAKTLYNMILYNKSMNPAWRIEDIRGQLNLTYNI